MMTQQGAAALREYRQLKATHDVEDASPHRLIQMMMERALEKIAHARGHIQNGDVGKKGSDLTVALDIINLL